MAERRWHHEQRQQQHHHSQEPKPNKSTNNRNVDPNRQFSSHSHSEPHVLRPTIIVADRPVNSYYSTPDIVQKLMMRVNARAEGNFAQADALRDDLIQHGIFLADRAGHITAAGPTKQSAYDTALAAARVCTSWGGEDGHRSPSRRKGKHSSGSPKSQAGSPRRGSSRTYQKNKQQNHQQGR